MSWTTPLESNNGDELADLGPTPCIAYNGTTYVTGGDGNSYNDAIIYWSTDPANTWNLVDLGAGAIFGIKWCPAFNKFVASGKTRGPTTGALWTSPDGQVWTPVTLSSAPAGPITALFFNGVTLYGVGGPDASVNQNYLVSTTNGASFTEQSNANTQAYRYIGTTDNDAVWDATLSLWLGILPNGAGAASLISTSTDFYTWTTAYDGTAGTFGFSSAEGPRRVGTNLVAFAQGPASTLRLISTDAVTWTPTPVVPDGSLAAFHVQVWIAAPDGVGIGARIWDGTGNANRFSAYYSADSGVNWVVASANAPNRFVDAGAGYTPRYVSLSVGGSDIGALFSQDLQSYAQQDPPDDANNTFEDVYYDGSTAILAGFNNVASNGGAAISVWVGTPATLHIQPPLLVDETFYTPTLCEGGNIMLALQMLNSGGYLVQGSVHTLTVLLTDVSTVYFGDAPSGTPTPVDAPGKVYLTYRTPSGRTIVDGALMTSEGGGTGYFTYSYTASATDETGPWYVTFRATKCGATGYFPSRPVFTVVR